MKKLWSGLYNCFLWAADAVIQVTVVKFVIFITTVFVITR